MGTLPTAKNMRTADLFLIGSIPAGTWARVP